MKSSERPPMRHKKGIQVVQPAHPHPKLKEQSKQFGYGSVQSFNRSRGISISRQTGISMNKIYDAKHFLPPKSPSQQTNKSQNTDFKTLTSVRSLKLISMFAQSNAQNTLQAQQLPPMPRKDVPRDQFEQKHEHLTSNKIRCNSPILKLGGTEDQKSSQNHKNEQIFLPNLLKF